MSSELEKVRKQRNIYRQICIDNGLVSPFNGCPPDAMSAPMKTLRDQLYDAKCSLETMIRNLDRIKEGKQPAQDGAGE